jgi:diguanylate cyclase (GGDEF)-like protein/PAS domain S-box-containing protein
MDGLERYLEVSPIPYALVRNRTVEWVNDALCELLTTAKVDLVGKELPLAGELKLDGLRATRTHAAIRHAGGYMLEVVITSTRVDEDEWMLELAPADYQGDRAAEYYAKLQVLADNVPVGIFVSENGLRLGYVNSCFAEIFHVLPAELLGTGWLDVFPENERDRLRNIAFSALTGNDVTTTLEVVTRDGEHKHLELVLKPVRVKETSLAFIGMVNDITERLRRELQATFELEHDSLTGLRNRRRLESDLAKAIEGLRANEIGKLWIGFCDLDGFKKVNDSLGHLAGDHVLIEIGNRLRTTEFPAYRYAGDEFVVLSNRDDVTAEALTKTLVEVISKPVAVGSARIVVNTSVGFVEVRTDDTVEQALGKADRAMYRAKGRKK